MNELTFHQPHPLQPTSHNHQVQESRHVLSASINLSPLVFPARPPESNPHCTSIFRPKTGSKPHRTLSRKVSGPTRVLACTYGWRKFVFRKLAPIVSRHGWTICGEGVERYKVGGVEGAGGRLKCFFLFVNPKKKVPYSVLGARYTDIRLRFCLPYTRYRHWPSVLRHSLY